MLDERRYTDMVGMFAENGVWFRQGKKLSGRAEIHAALSGRSPTTYIRHVISNVFSESIDTDTQLFALMTAYRFDDGKYHEEPLIIEGPFRISSVIARLRHTGSAWSIMEMNAVPRFEFKAASTEPSCTPAQADGPAFDKFRRI